MKTLLSDELHLWIDESGCRSRDMVRNVLHNYLHESEVNIYYNRYGKPYIQQSGSAKKIFFNISHSLNKLVVGVAAKEFGIDVEIKLPANMISIAKNFFHENEYQFLIKLHPQELAEGFKKIWMAKEAYIKMLGMGLNRKLNTFQVDLSRFLIMDKQPLSFELFKFDENDICAIAPKFFKISLFKYIAE